MRLAVSNLAWSIEREEEVAKHLLDFGVNGIEIAPTKVWPKPLEADEDALKRYRDFWEQRGLPIVALQSLLFEKPHLRIFADGDHYREAADYLRGLIRLAGKLGATAMVFGSPKNRAISPQTPEQVRTSAVAFFRNLGDVALENNTCLCIEPNPTDYRSDYITAATEGLDLVREIDHLGIGLHLDSACMKLSGDSTSIVSEALPCLRHFHISEPFLAPVGQSSFDHSKYGAALRDVGYDRWVSIEMLPAKDGFDLQALSSACQIARREYLGNANVGPKSAA